jgi:hypothetical protein
MMEDYQDIRQHILIDRRHGGPYDRGSADSYYRRPRRPHFYKGDTGTSDRVEYKDMTPDEVVAYMAGYDDNEESGDHKEWF